MLRGKSRAASALALVLAVFLTASACEEKNDPLPPELIKVWRTSDPAFRHRHMEIRSDYVIFGTGEYSISMHPIRRVESSKGRGDSVEYLIEYSDIDGEIFHIKLVYTGGDRPELRLANHDEIWRPEASKSGGT